MSFLRFRSSDSFINSPPRPATDDNDFNLFLLHRVCSQPALLLPADSLRALQFSPFQYFPLDKDDDGGNRNPPAPRERVRCRLELIPDQGVTAASTAADLQSLPDPFLHPQPSSELDFVFFFFSDRHRDTNATRARPGMIAGCADH